MTGIVFSSPEHNDVSVVRHASSTISLTPSPPKPLGQLRSNLAGMFLGRSSSKFVHRI